MTVQEWLNSERNYEVGRQLYAALGDNDRLKRMFQSGPSHYNREAVAWELTKLAKAGQLSVVSCPLPVGGRPGLDDYGNRVAPERYFLPLAEQEALQNDESQTKAGRKLDEAAGAVLDELRDARRPLYDERSGLHAQLEGLPTEADRYLVACRIMALSQELSQNWEQDKYVRAHGQLPPPPALAVDLATLAPAELLKHRNNLRSRVSKLKNKPARANDLAQVQTELAQVEAQLSHE
jgi:hypothetical protein